MGSGSDTRQVRASPPVAPGRRRTLLPFVILALLPSPLGLAQDLGAGAAAPAWTGWYLGGHVGYAAGMARTTLLDPSARTSTNRFGILTGGLQLGYAHLLASRLVLGLEADLSFPDFHQDADRITYPGAAAGGVDERLDLVGTVRGRVGLAIHRSLIYGTGGLAWSLGHFVDVQSRAERWRARPGWTAGAGVEIPVDLGWTTRLEYAYEQLRRTGASFAGAGTSSTVGIHHLRLALDWWPGAGDVAAAPATPGGRNWNLHGQFTFVGQGYPGFRSPYEGASSLQGAGQFRNTASLTGFLGLRLWPGAEFYFNPEFMQGFGLNDVHGVAAFPNGEAQKSSFLVPRFNPARLYLSQTIGFGGEQEVVEDGPNQLPGRRDVSRLTVTAGKFSVTDFFLVNAYAGEPRTTFLNWNIYGGGSYDWTMDRLSWTWGGLVELNRKAWALRLGYFLLPVVSNADDFDTHVFERGQYAAEVEVRYAPFRRPGTLKLFGWLNHGYIGGYADALAQPLASQGYPDITTTRRQRINYGFVASVEQAFTDDLGMFSRVSWSPGHVEVMGWTDCDASLSLGAVLKGGPWGRKADAVGLAWVIEGLSPVARRYFAAGGQGILIGDGKLDYRPEAVFEAYYSYSPFRWGAVTADYQLVIDPGYNADRGPVSVFSLRLHAAF